MRYKRKNRKKLMKKKDDTEDSPTEVLSQDEIDQLLTAINAGDTEPECFRPMADCRKIKIYDFKRPDKFSKDQIRTVSIMYETFARQCTTFLSSKLKCMAHIHVASVDQLTYEEFIRSIPTPTTLAIINPDPLPSAWIIEIDPAITFMMLNIMVGGHPDYAIQQQHELTDLEACLMEDIIVRQLGCLREAWSNLLDLRPRLGQIETNPQFMQIVSPCEMTVLVTLECKVGDVEGMLNVCMPYLSLEPVIKKMTAENWYRNYTQKNENTKMLIDKVDLSTIDCTLRAEIHNTICTLDEISKMDVGTVVPIGETLLNLLKLDNTIIGRFAILEKYNNKTIEINEILNEVEKNFMLDKHNVKYSTGALKDVKIQLSVELGRAIRSLKDIEGFGEGTILELDKLAGEPVDVFANNILIAKGEVVVIDENFGVRFTETFDEIEE